MVAETRTASPGADRRVHTLTGSVAIVVFTAVLVVGGVWSAFISSGVAIDANVISGSERVVDGEPTVLVRWTTEQGVPRTARVTVPDEHVGADQLPLVRKPDGYEVQQRSSWDWAVLIGAGAVGALLGLVIVGALSGFGMVRGRGEFGTMSRHDVDESRGFYWRS